MISELSAKLKYFTKSDLESHCTSESAYVCIYNKIFDVTKPIQSTPRELGTENLLRNAGKDVSHFFHPLTNLPILKSDFLRETNPSQRQNQLLHFDQNLMDSKPKQKITPWFLDDSLQVGLLSSNEVLVRIVNMLTFDEDLLVVPVEETLTQICQRYLAHNYHAASYTWKDIEHRKLTMAYTLQQNGILEDNLLMDYLHIPDKQRPITSIFIHFNDDLTDM